MAIKDKNSIYDLSNGPVSNMSAQQGPQFQRTLEEASEKHIESLQQVPGPPSNSPFQDLNGAQGPQSQLPVRDASERHIDSLTKQIQITNQGVGIFTDPYYAGPSTLDLNGNPGPLFNRGADSTLKQDSLVNIYKSNINPGASFGAGQKGGTWPNVRPTPVGANFADLDGLTPRGYVNPDTGASF